MGYICTRCGGTNVACEAIVNPNTGKIIDYFDGLNGTVYVYCIPFEGNEYLLGTAENPEK